jgi:hypothetical protein
VTSLHSLQGLGVAIPGFERYPERALLLAGAGDAVCVPGPVDPEYLVFLAGLGLGPRPEHVIVAGGNGRGAGRPLAERLLCEPGLLSRAARALGAEEVTIEPYAMAPWSHRDTLVLSTRHFPEPTSAARRHGRFDSFQTARYSVNALFRSCRRASEVHMPCAKCC